MKIKTTPKEIFDEVDKGEGYNQNIGLYDNVKRNNNFYHDKQWEGVNAPNLDKPVFNILKPAVRYYIGQLVSDDIGVSIDFDDGDNVNKYLENALQTKIDTVFENVKFNHKTRQFIQNAAVDGDGCLYWFWDTENNRLDCQMVNNTDVIFGDVSTPNVAEQPYIIIKQRKLTTNLKIYAKSVGCKEYESITSDGGNSYNEYNSDTLPDSYTDVAIKFWRADDRKIHWLMCTRTVEIIGDTDLMISHYPIVWMPWEQDKNSYHGISPITGQINNQIFVNKIYAMAMEYQKNFAFPKLLYDATLIPKWSNKVGQAIAVNGNPQTALFASFAPSGMNSQAIELVESTITKTKDSLGVYDAALGNVKPDNTSAIIAVQQASAQPLNSQKLDFYQAIEDCVYIILDFFKNYDPLLTIKVEQTDMMGAVNEVPLVVDMSAMDFNKMHLKVEVGAASYWSELLNVQTIDNMMQLGIIPDAVTYLESIPDGYIKNKADLIKAIEDKQQQVAQQQMMAQTAQIPNGVQMPLQ